MPSPTSGAGYGCGGVPKRQPKVVNKPRDDFEPPEPPCRPSPVARGLYEALRRGGRGGARFSVFSPKFELDRRRAGRRWRSLFARNVLPNEHDRSLEIPKFKNV